MTLDPLFMFVLLPKGNEVIGAAIATAISNSTALGYFPRYVFRHRKVRIFRFSLKGHPGKSLRITALDILKYGVPSFFLLAAGQVSNFFLIGSILALTALLPVNMAIQGAADGFSDADASAEYSNLQNCRQQALSVTAYGATSPKGRGGAAS